MIVSASRRTDIPAFHSEWFLRRLKAGYAVVCNPYNNGSIHRVVLTPDVVDCIAFRTKNPAPMTQELGRMSDYNYFFQYTINPYGAEIETNVPSLNERVKTFIDLSKRIGRERMVWRYDPVFISPDYDLDFHFRSFEKLASQLAPYTHRCMMGFIILHPFVAKRTNPFSIEPRNSEDIYRIAGEFAEVGLRYGMLIETCAEETDLEQYGIRHGACIDRKHVENIVGYPFGNVKEKYLRKYCNCMESIDIGCYSTCLNGCIYCYATINKPKINASPENISIDPGITATSISQLQRSVTDLACRSFKADQLSLF